MFDQMKPKTRNTLFIKKKKIVKSSEIHLKKESRNITHITIIYQISKQKERKG